MFIKYIQIKYSETPLDTNSNTIDIIRSNESSFSGDPFVLISDPKREANAQQRVTFQQLQIIFECIHLMLPGFGRLMGGE